MDRDWNVSLSSCTVPSRIFYLFRFGFFIFQPTYGGIGTKSTFNIIMLCVNKHDYDRCCLIDYRCYFLVILTRCPWPFIVPLPWYLLCYNTCLSRAFVETCVFMLCMLCPRYYPEGQAKNISIGVWKYKNKYGAKT